MKSKKEKSVVKKAVKVSKEEVLKVVKYLVAEGFHDVKVGEVEEKVGLLED